MVESPTFPTIPSCPEAYQFKVKRQLSKVVVNYVNVVLLYEYNTLIAVRKRFIAKLHLCGTALSLRLNDLNR